MESMSLLQIITLTVLWAGAFGGTVAVLFFGAYALMHVLDPILDYAKLVLTTRLQKRARRNRLI